MTDQSKDKITKIIKALLAKAAGTDIEAEASTQRNNSMYTILKNNKPVVYNLNRTICLDFLESVRQLKPGAKCQFISNGSDMHLILGADTYSAIMPQPRKGD
jgi:hypothetical protein